MKFLTDILAKASLVVDGAVTLNSVANSSVDTDRFLVIESNIVKYRTGTQLLSDIGAAAAAAGLPPGGTAGQILAKIDATNYNAEWIDNYTSNVRHLVKLASAMTVGTPVYVSGSTGQSGTNMIVSPASNTSEATSSKTLGLLMTGGATNDIVFVVTEGLLAGLNTSSAVAGDPVWLGPNGTLLYGLANKPVAPVHMVFIGVVTRAQTNNGEIFVKVQNGYELEELHNVLITDVADKHFLYRDGPNNLWKNASISTILGYTPASSTSVSGTINRVAKFTSASAVGDSQIFDNGTNVSIGTLTPISTSILTLTSTSVLTKSIFLDSTWSYQTSFSMRNGNYYTEFNLGGATKNTSEGGPGSFQIAHYNASNGQYIIPITFFANGNIAFAGGTVAVPADQGQTLQVQGSTRISALAGTDTRLVTADANGILGVSGLASGIVTGSGTANYIPKWTPNSTTLGNSQLQDNGTNVGIGVTTLQSAIRLDVRPAPGENGVAIAGYGYGGNGGAGLNGIGYATTGTGSTYGIYASSFGVRAGGTNIGGYFDASGAASNYALITGSGNVGIGTTTPQQKLVVSNAGVEGLEFIPAPSVNSNQIQSYNRSTSAFNSLVLRASEYNVQIGTNPALFINNSSNVGIGTSSPTQKLVISDSIDGSLITWVQNENVNGYSVLRLGSTMQQSAAIVRNGSSQTSYAGANSLNVYTLSTQPIGLVTNNLLRMIVTGDGNVGIGTSTPVGKLEVNAAGVNTVFNSAGATDARLEFKYNGTRKGLLNWDSTLVGIQVDTGNNFYITGGSTGIGTTTPAASAQLDVTSTTRGFLPPRMTAAQRGAISSPAIGLVVYQTDGNEGLWIYTNGNGWKALAIVL